MGTKWQPTPDPHRMQIPTRTLNERQKPITKGSPEHNGRWGEKVGPSLLDGCWLHALAHATQTPRGSQLPVVGTSDTAAKYKVQKLNILAPCVLEPCTSGGSEDIQVFASWRHNRWWLWLLVNCEMGNLPLGKLASSCQPAFSPACPRQQAP